MMAILLIRVICIAVRTSRIWKIKKYNPEGKKKKKQSRNVALKVAFGLYIKMTF